MWALFKIEVMKGRVKNIEELKDEIPDFVIKLYLILSKKEFEDFICWAQEGTEILIKNAKKFEDRVLPRFFRHKRLTSFVRQLNMYQFNKVNKITKERGYMYFKNDHFKIDCFDQIRLIKRNHRSRKNDKSPHEPSEDGDSLLERSHEQDFKFFKEDAQLKFLKIQQILQGILEKQSHLKEELAPILTICKKMVEETEFSSLRSEVEADDLFREELEEDWSGNNMLGTTIREMNVVINSLIPPSICSLTNLLTNPEE